MMCVLPASYTANVVVFGFLYGPIHKVRPRKGASLKAFDEVVNRQRHWAEQRGLHPDIDAYLPTIIQNLFAPLSATTEAEFRTGAGNELTDRPGEAAKMRAVHSSSALVCNVFDCWRNADTGAISRALGISDSLTDFHFEARLPTGLRGTPPTLDLLLVASDTRAWGVESKFTEPFQGRKTGPLFAEAYFEHDVGLWTALGLPKCQDLAERLNLGQIEFVHLDAAQLLKHALGVRRKYLEGQLVLLWYNVEAPEAEILSKEIRLFNNSVDVDLGFRSVTYQEAFESLSHEPAANHDHVEYLRSRYFAV